MSVKATSDIFKIREGVTQTIEMGGSNQSASLINTVKIPTNLDTLGREVLEIQEMDFDFAGIGFLCGIMGRQGASLDPAALTVNCDLDIVLTEVDPAVDPSSLELVSPHFIGGRKLVIMGGLVQVEDTNPDTASFNSVASSKSPIFTTASSDLYISVLSTFNGNNPATGGNVNIRGSARIMANRGKSDADTYAAILTGLYS